MAHRQHPANAQVVGGDWWPASRGSRIASRARRRIETQTLLPCAETVPMLLWALMTSGQIQLRQMDGWEIFAWHIAPIRLSLRPDLTQIPMLGRRRRRVFIEPETQPG